MDDRTFSAEGRQVRCVSCGHSWHQSHPGQKTESLVTPKEQDDTAPVQGPGFVFADPIYPPSDEREISHRYRASPGWLLFWGITILTLALSILMREQIADTWPPARVAYSAIGALNHGDLKDIEFENLLPVHFKDAGNSYCFVKGDIVNKSHVIKTLPTIHMSFSMKCDGLTDWEKFKSKWFYGNPGDTGTCTVTHGSHSLSEPKLLPRERVSFESKPVLVPANTTSVTVSF